MNKKIIIYILALLIISQLVFALGIRPAKTTVNSNDVQEYSGNFWVVNNDNQEMKLKVYVTGEMAEYIQLDVNEFTFREDENSQQIKFDVNLPDEVPLGESTATIVVEEEFGDSSDGGIYSKLILKHKIIIIGEYPNKYLTAKLNFYEDDNNLRLIAELENLGNDDLNEVKVTYYVNDQKTVLKTLESEKIFLAKGSNELLGVELEKSSLGIGEFEVVAKVEYDDNTLEVVKNLVHGQPEIDITYFNKYFIAGVINPYTIELLNKWNQEIENVFVDIVIKKKLENGEFEVVDEFRTESIDISASQRDLIKNYLDVTNQEKGDYVFSLIVNFWNIYKMDQKEFEVKLLDSEEELTGLTSLTVADGQNHIKEGLNIIDTILVLVISLLTIVIIVIIFALVKLRRKDV
ncbi:MAG: hypothetical protein ABIG93_05060 [archaeon]|nr:hypothetical protein [Nanoarchaeota archaeon]